MNVWRWLGSLVCMAGLCVVVGLAPVHYVLKLETYRDGVQQTAELGRDDARSLDRISELGPGGVLTAWELAAWAPVVTDDPTWNGHPVWSKLYFQRAKLVARLFDRSAQRTPTWARRFVASTRARFVLEPCGSTARLEPILLPAGFTVQRIGCATLYLRGART